MGSAGCKTSHKDVEIGRDWIIFALIFVMDFNSFFREHTDAGDIVFVALVKHVKINWSGKFFQLCLVRFLAKFPPH